MKGSENETIYLMWSGVLCIAAAYDSPRGDNLGNTILPYRNGNQFHIRTVVEGGDAHAAV